MGRPDADPSQQIQTEYELQPHQQYEPTHDEYLAETYQNNNNNNNNQHVEQQLYPPPPQNNPMYPKPAAYPPQPEAVQYPPKGPPPTNQTYMMHPSYQPAASPYKPGPAGPAVPGIPVGLGGGEGWRSGLFDFMEDPNSAIQTALFPCLTFGQIAEIVDDGHTTCGSSGMIYGAMSWFAMPCLLSCTYRTKLRNKFGLPEVPAPDWVTHFLCEWCALCQEYRELQHRGWDPTIGYQGNMARNQMQQQPRMMAPMDQRMMS